jgi:SAM-dependent methyltransferase
VLELAVDSFGRYLSTKKSVDDRSLNLRVYQKLNEALAGSNHIGPWRIVEIGCGIGTMIERMWDWNLVSMAAYIAIDREAALIAEARVRLEEFSRCRHLIFTQEGETCRLTGEGRDWLISFRTEDFMAFCHNQAGKPGWDLILAHAFLDLVDLDICLAHLRSLLAPGGFYYFTLNFDGGTIWYPPVDPAFEDLLIRLYHQSMDERQGGGEGHSQTGRRLLRALGLFGGEILAAGSADWVVWPTVQGTYPAGEAYFLDYILETIFQAVVPHPGLDQGRLHAWLAQRRDQLETGKLIFMAHQLDVCGRL